MTPAEAIHETRKWLVSRQLVTDDDLDLKLSKISTDLGRVQWLKDQVRRQIGKRRKVPHALVGWLDDALALLKAEEASDEDILF